MFIPAIGIVSRSCRVLPPPAGRLHARSSWRWSPIGFISFGLWVHHMFATGLTPTALGFFAASSLLIAIPSGVQIFGWIATLWTGPAPSGRRRCSSSLGFILIFVMGGVTGAMVGVVPFDLQVHDSFFVVAHFHYVLIGGVSSRSSPCSTTGCRRSPGGCSRSGSGSGLLADVRRLQRRLLPDALLGLLGMPRRVYTYEPGSAGETRTWSRRSAPGLRAERGAADRGQPRLEPEARGARQARIRGTRGRSSGGSRRRRRTRSSSSSPSSAAGSRSGTRSRSGRSPKRSTRSASDGAAPQRADALARRVCRLRAGRSSDRDRADAAVDDLAFRHVVGFVATLAGLLLENLWILGPGLTIDPVSLHRLVLAGQGPGRGHRGDRDRARARQAPPRRRRADLRDNGWWAMLVFLLVMATSGVATFIAELLLPRRRPRLAAGRAARAPGDAGHARGRSSSRRRRTSSPAA